MTWIIQRKSRHVIGTLQALKPECPVTVHQAEITEMRIITARKANKREREAYADG
jgi:uncharacterized DUF497 family protein